MKKLLWMAMLLTFSLSTMAASSDKGKITVKTVARNAVRVQYTVDGEQPLPSLPNWLYVKNDEVKKSDITVDWDVNGQVLRVKDKRGRVVFTTTRHQLQTATAANQPCYEATMGFATTKDEYLYGLGQFQDGYSNVRGLSRRLTQVNTQISIPMLLSSKGYGILWNNY